MMRTTRSRTVAVLGAAQTLAWASTYYLPAMLAAPMARDLGVSMPTVFAAFSVALIISALLGPFAGRSIDRWGGRPVLMTTNLVFALGLAALAAVPGPAGLFGAWIVIGVGMGSGLYEAAFSTLVRLYGRESRNAITGVTLIAGFASTLGWPLSSWLEAELGWRGTCAAWAALHLLLGLPLNAFVPRATTSDRGEALAAGAPNAGAASPRAPSTRARLTPLLLAFVFAATWVISTAMATHLPGLLQASGASLAAAVAVGALVGPAQVTGRLLEFGLLRRLHPLLSARLAALAHPLGAATLLAAGTQLAPLFAVQHGAGNGILTIAMGTLPLVLFGPQGYGARQGWLMVPARIAQAFSPFLFGLALERWGGQTLWLSGALGLAAFAALAALRAPAARREPLAAG
jgi:MFS family permease